MKTPMRWLGAAALAVGGLLLWTMPDRAPANESAATAAASRRVPPSALPVNNAAPAVVAGLAAPAQLEQTLDGEARLEAQGDAARRKLIERTLPRLVRQAERAERAGDTQRAALLRRRIAHFRSVRDEDREVADGHL